MRVPERVNHKVMEIESADIVALLEWQAELGADEPLGDTPVDRYAQSEKALAPKPAPVAAVGGPPLPVLDQKDPVAEAKIAAASAHDLESLRTAMAGFEHCELRNGARNLVFSDGQMGARVMIVGEAPDRDEDAAGKPFVGTTGQFLDRMLAAIGMARDTPDGTQTVYITNVLPWRPPQNRAPSEREVAMMRPFLERHIALAKPDVLVLMGNVACQGVLAQKGITRLRGNWTEAFGVPCLPMLHPAYLLRTPTAKRDAWADLLALQARLKDMS